MDNGLFRLTREELRKSSHKLTNSNKLFHDFSIEDKSAIID